MMSQTHIRGYYDDNKAYCGEILDNTFSFKDIESAVINGVTESKIQCCFGCIEKIHSFLRKGW